MPNEVFLRTRAGLSALVSSRAAGRILEGALKGRGHSPDDVDMRQMQKALLGPVLHELEGVLPRAGLRRNLERLARSLRAAESAESSTPVASTVQGVGNGSSTASHASSSRTFAANDSNYPAAFHGSGPASGSRDEASTGVSGTVSGTGRVAVAEAPTTPAKAVVTGITRADAVAGRAVRRSLTAAEIDRHVQSFTQIEHVRMVTLFRQDGSVAVNRGEGLDLAALARLSRLALTLLAKRGTVRQMHLGHSEGQLFLFPIGTDLLTVFGGSGLNLGTVTTAFTALALEEEE